MPRSAFGHDVLSETRAHEAFFGVERNGPRVDRLLLLKVGVLLRQSTTRIILTSVSENLRHSDGDVVVLAAQIVEPLRRRVHHLDPVLVKELQLFHPRTSELLILAQEVRFAGQAVGSAGQRLDETVLQLLLDAVGEPRLVHVITEAVRE